MYKMSLCLVIFFCFQVHFSHISITTPAFLCLLLTYFFHPFTFNQIESLNLKGVSCRRHKTGSCFFIHTANLCLLIGVFNLFTLNVSIDIVRNMSDISHFIFYMYLVIFVPVFLTYCFLLHQAFFSVTFNSFNKLCKFNSFYNIFILLFYVFWAYHIYIKLSECTSDLY